MIPGAMSLSLARRSPPANAFIHHTLLIESLRQLVGMKRVSDILRLQDFESDWNCQMLACWGHVLDFCSAGIVDMNPDGEFKGRVLGIGFAAYQWGNSNDQIGNVKKLTKNAINYLTGEVGEGIEDTKAAVKAVKTIENGQIVILKNGVRYNALGVQL